MAMISPELLRRYPHFATLDDEVLRKLAMISEERSHEADTLLFEEGDPADNLGVIVEGSVDLFSVDGTGRRCVVGTLVGGDLMSLSAVIGPHQLRFGGLAREVTRVVAVDGVKLRALMSEDHDFGYRVLLTLTRALGQRLESTRIQLAAQA